MLILNNYIKMLHFMLHDVTQMLHFHEYYNFMIYVVNYAFFKKCYKCYTFPAPPASAFFLIYG